MRPEIHRPHSMIASVQPHRHPLYVSLMSATHVAAAAGHRAGVDTVERVDLPVSDVDEVLVVQWRPTSGLHKGLA
jgi:hypothetical protein